MFGRYRPGDIIDFLEAEARYSGRKCEHKAGKGSVSNVKLSERTS